MNDRQRFVATMHYQPRDRCPICDFGFWPETIVDWHSQGLPAWVTGGHDTTFTNQFFGMDEYSGGPRLNCGLWPPFESKIVEDRGDHEVVRQDNGVLVLQKKFMSSIPAHLGHLLVDRASWETHYKPRLDPDSPGRIPDWAPLEKVWRDDNHPVPRMVSGGSLYGVLRDWMGIEAVSYLVHDDPALFEEMVTTLAALVVEVHRRAFAHGARYDVAAMWEDMCYNTGPLLSPAHFKKFLVPHYRRITEQLRAHGCDVIFVDCDGNIDELLPLWLDAGVNCMFPIEVGTWGGDPVKYRMRYGKSLLMMGGVDKHILARSPREIEREVHRLAPLVEEGGYIPMPDHRVPPDVPLANHLCYLTTARNVWGKGIDLKPLGALDRPAISAASATPSPR